MHTETEENYLKCILKYSLQEEVVYTNTIAAHLGTSAASVTDMLKKLSEKQLVHYKPYKGVSLSEEGRRIALAIVRKHRLWEVFLVEKLKFSWDNIHEVAEQLEHIESQELIRRLDDFLNYPKFDPHGDPIPDEYGAIESRNTRLLSEIQPGETAIVAGVGRSDPDFLQYLERVGLTLEREVRVMEHLGFDESVLLEIGDQHTVISGTVARNLFVLQSAL
ncbi:MAG: metal-dependent transcriptional regulator [Bacteroidetes bacterium]|nr:MAG: metal-dependent transcriptional regulator [Bacteroidota bacterium]